MFRPASLAIHVSRTLPKLSLHCGSAAGRGLDLCVPIEQKKVAGKAVHSIGGGVLLACLSEKITRDEVEPLAQGIVAWHKALASAGDTTCVFRDSAFADDVAKTNLAAILSQHGLQNVRSL